MGREGVIFLLIVVFISLASASTVRINEVELNPSGSDNKNEWIELYFTHEISLDGWTIVNAKEKVFSQNLFGSFPGRSSVFDLGSNLCPPVPGKPSGHS